MGTHYRALGLCATAAFLGAAGAADAAWLCRHVPVVDDAGGTAIVGIEDIAVDFSANVAYLSAYDRRAGDGFASLGAIYRLAPEALDDETPTATALQIVGRPHFILRPHGIALGPGGTLYAINRRIDPSSDPVPVIENFAIEGNGLAYLGSLSAPALCRPNDLAVTTDGRLLVTNDLGNCEGWRSIMGTIFNLADGFIMAIDGERAALWADGFRYANGITARGDAVFVAATRAQAIFRLSLDGKKTARIEVPGAPDNLSWGSDGALYATGFPSLFGFARFRRDREARTAAPTQVYRIDPAIGAVETFAIDPAGLPAGGSVAVRWGGWLLVGAAYDYGLGICHEDGAP